MNGLEVVADVLLVEAWLRSAGSVAISRPEAGRVGRERLVDEDDPILGPARSGKQAELELRVGDDDPDGFGVRRSFGVELQRQVANPGKQPVADQVRRLRLGDVD